MTEATLFPNWAPSIEERAKEIDVQIESLLYGRSGGTLGLTLNDNEKRVLELIRYHHGAAHAISIGEMQRMMGDTGKYILTDREIKKAVRTLRVQFHVPIGSSKQGAAGGYFIMLTPEDHAILHSQVLDQVRAELEVLKSVDGPQAALELLGQLQLEVQ